MNSHLPAYNCLHGKARDKASGLQAGSLRAVVLLVCTLPSVLSVAAVCRDERDDLFSSAHHPAHVRGCTIAGNLSSRYRMSKSLPSVLDGSDLRPPGLLVYMAFVPGTSRTKSRSFLPAPSSALFLIPVG